MAKGLLTRVLPDDQLVDEVMRVAHRLAKGAPLAVSLNKQTITRLCSSEQPLSDCEYKHFFSYARSKDHHEGVDAFLAGKAPVFSGE